MEWITLGSVKSLRGTDKQSTSLFPRKDLFMWVQEGHKMTNSLHQTETWIRELAGTQRLGMMESMRIVPLCNVSTVSSLTWDFLVSVSPLTALSYHCLWKTCPLLKPPCPVASLLIWPPASPDQEGLTWLHVFVPSTSLSSLRSLWCDTLEIQKIQSSIHYSVKGLAES